MREFWVSSGHHLVRRADHGGLMLTPELLIAYRRGPNCCRPMKLATQSARCMAR